MVARFEAERQALALMDHPNIAKVLDAAGTTETGRPYFVMELVKGIPITKFFEQEGTEVDKKLALFIRVCQFISGISFSPDGRLLYTASLDGHARCWDVATMERVGRGMRSQLMALHSLGPSPDGCRLMTGPVDGRVTIWDTEA